MDSLSDECIKHREILFDAVHDQDKSPTRCATLLLADAPGIISLRPVSDTQLHISYDLRTVNLSTIETALREVGFHLDNSLMCKLRRALCHFTEETQCLNMGYLSDSKTTRDIYICRYLKRPHGCRDERPDHWREYR